MTTLRRYYPVALCVLGLLLLWGGCANPGTSTARTGQNSVNYTRLFTNQDVDGTPTDPYRGRHEVWIKCLVRTIHHSPGPYIVFELKAINHLLTVRTEAGHFDQHFEIALPESGLIGRLATDEVRAADRELLGYSANVDARLTGPTWTHVKEFPCLPFREWTERWVKLTVHSTAAPGSSDTIVHLLSRPGVGVEFKHKPFEGVPIVVTHSDSNQLDFGDIWVPHQTGIAGYRNRQEQLE